MSMLKNIIILVLINIAVSSAVSPSAIPSKRILRHVAKIYCVANDTASQQQLEAAKEYVCKRGANCKRIMPGQSCYNPNTLKFHTSVVINSYFRNHIGQQYYCTGDGPLRGVGTLIFWDPSQGSCTFD